MLTLLIVTAILTALELLLWLPIGKSRQQYAAVMILISVVTSVYLVVRQLDVFTLFYGYLTIYRVISLARVATPRRQEKHLYRLARRSTLTLTITQLLMLAASYGLSKLTVPDEIVPYVAGAGLIISIGFLLNTQRQLFTTRPPKVVEQYAVRNLPTLTIAIPARNETDSLNECLKTLLHSTYPKLEIIVLDDCSQNKRTPEIIKSFAHDGVRFVAGKPPDTNWLAKNYAYEQLAATANGELLLFCGVDARFMPETLTLLVESMLQKNKTMISVLPANVVPPKTEFESLLVQPTRYAWELVLPRRPFQRPAVLSTCWIINKKLLKSAGGFAACSRAISPERTLARYAATHDDGYSFMQSDTLTGVSSDKPLNEQQDTALRTRYPLLHQHIELAALVTIVELIVFALPFITLLGALASGYTGVILLAGANVIVLTILYAQVMQVTYRRFIVRSLWLLPFATLYDVAILNYSLYKYEFSEVFWKGRNVCIPVMRVIPELPKI
jgi:glycosyltransferase involved in cell wall biosynthesis